MSEADGIKFERWMKKRKNFLIYCGNPGIGKTYFCAAMIEWILDKFNSFRYWNESELFKRVRSSMDKFQGDYLETLKHLVDDEIVMLDDIGSTGLNEWRKEIIFDAIDERYNSELPTIVTSNYSRKEFEDLFHPRLSSRLFADESVLIEILEGQDLRKSGK